METYPDWYHHERSRTSEPVDAALSPSEWADQRYRGAGGEAWTEGGGALRAEGAFGAGERRALASLALRDEPLGFTWHDVDFIRSLVLADDHHSPDDWFILQRLGERIAALLPPREQEHGAESG